MSEKLRPPPSQAPTSGSLVSQVNGRFLINMSRWPPGHLVQHMCAPGFAPVWLWACHVLGTELCRRETEGKARLCPSLSPVTCLSWHHTVSVFTALPPKPWGPALFVPHMYCAPPPMLSV